MAMVNARSHKQTVDDGHRVLVFQKGTCIAEDAVSSTEVLGWDAACQVRQRRI